MLYDARCGGAHGSLAKFRRYLLGTRVLGHPHSDFPLERPATPTSDVVVLGVDPGLGTTGYGAIRLVGRHAVVVEAGVLRTDTKRPLATRLAGLYEDFRDLLAELRPDAIAVEDLHSRVQHPRTSIIMGHARGVLLLAAAQIGVAVEAYTASRVKQSVTGSGRAPKEQVGRSVASRLGLPEVPQPSDVTDALAIALCHANRLWHASLASGR